MQNELKTDEVRKAMVDAMKAKDKDTKRYTFSFTCCVKEQSHR